MFEGNIAAQIGKRIAAFLGGMAENFVHSGDIRAGADDGRQVLQRALQRIVQA